MGCDWLQSVNIYWTKFQNGSSVCVAECEQQKGLDCQTQIEMVLIVPSKETFVFK
jgi:hypothetical protein